MSAPAMVSGWELDALVATLVMGIDPATFRYAARREAPFPNEDGSVPVTQIGRNLTRDVAEETCARENGYVTADHRELHGEFRVVVSNVEPYSTDVAAAWEVVAKLREMHADVMLTTRTPQFTEFYCEVSGWVKHERVAYSAGADTAPLTICLAALDAVNATATTELDTQTRPLGSPVPEPTGHRGSPSPRRALPTEGEPGPFRFGGAR